MGDLPPLPKDRGLAAEVLLRHFVAELHRRKWRYTGHSDDVFDVLDQLGVEMGDALGELESGDTNGAPRS